MRPLALFLALLLLEACSVDPDVPIETATESAVTADPTTAATTTASATAGPDTHETADPPCGGPCDAPNNPCDLPQGICEAGECVYPPAPQGTPCDLFGCTRDDTCDGASTCLPGPPIECTRANAVGICVGGDCGAWECIEPWANCDDDWDNGCEVPVGVANVCSEDGLGEPDACWTAYCGSSNGAEANFGTFYCTSCETCQVPDQGLVQWCDTQTGRWFPPGEGSCGDAENRVCPP